MKTNLSLMSASGAKRSTRSVGERKHRHRRAGAEMKKQITRAQYIKAQDKLAELNSDAARAMNAGDQKQLDRLTKKSVKQFAIIADYKDQQVNS
jgi:hypothetical protein